MGRPRIVHGSPKIIQWIVELSTALVVTSREPAKILAISVNVKMIQLLHSRFRITSDFRIVHGLPLIMLLLVRVNTVMIRVIYQLPLILEICVFSHAGSACNTVNIDWRNLTGYLDRITFEKSSQ